MPAPLPPHSGPTHSPARQMPRGPQRQPLEPNLPPDTPLEPGAQSADVRVTWHDPESGLEV